ncbi:hypothetical protein [Variovorax atrisoli]|jgi:hypothetical protein|uniref:hypothetical protein n=1 Tax=Variovorax atrisoli TaxID=3394203 RepID=UPI0010496EAB|nr:hypothetical protein [Variovorax paradoxus]MDR6519226.1 hypothetical protein [Variovorax paradoxus]
MFITRSSSGDSATKPLAARVTHALEIHRNVAACNAHIALDRHSTHALTAALMLPCYKAEFRTLVLAMSSEEERELRYALNASCASVA